MRVSGKQVAGGCVNLLLALGTGVLFCVYGPSEFERIQAIASTLATLAGTLFGLILTAASLLLSGMGKRLIANMRITGHFQRLVWALIMASACWLFSMFACLAVLFVQSNNSRTFLSLAISLSVLSLLATIFSAGKKMALVLLYWGHD